MKIIQNRSDLVRLALTIVVAGVLLAGVALWWQRAMLTPGLFGLDLRAYFAAAERLIDTGSPYSVELLAGPIANEGANVPIGYLYPPPLAQVFVFMPDTRAFGVVWAGLQVALLGVLMVKFGRLARLGGSLGWFAWIVAWLSFFPLHMAVLIGNLSGWVALALGAMLIGPARGVGLLAALVAILKGLTAPLVLAALVIRPYRIWAVIGLAAVVVPSCVASFRSWIDWTTVLGNLSRMTPGQAPANLAFASVLAPLGLAPLGDGLRFASLLVLAFATIGALRRGRSRQALAMAGLTTLLLSATAWDHHFALLAPIAAAAWPIASRWERRAILLALLAQVAWWTHVVGYTPALVLALISLWIGAVAAALALGRGEPADLSEGSGRSNDTVRPASSLPWSSP